LVPYIYQTNLKLIEFVKKTNGERHNSAADQFHKQKLGSDWKSGGGKNVTTSTNTPILGKTKTEESQSERKNAKKKLPH